MNLLLLLTALLSALSGVGQAVRGGVRAPAMVCASAARRPAAAVQRRAVASRPVQSLPGIVAAVVRPLTAFRLSPVQPLFASRRRE